MLFILSLYAVTWLSLDQITTRINFYNYFNNISLLLTFLSVMKPVWSRSPQDEMISSMRP